MIVIVLPRITTEIQLIHANSKVCIKKKFIMFFW